ncbi:MAG: hypothetical protein CM15mP21_3780 [Hyphomicrobiales bacterium]|nr:MAG: hypothetical protein CM15mP21_3780 [Hyphomicrobiales bacterium]
MRPSNRRIRAQISASRVNHRHQAVYPEPGATILACLLPDPKTMDWAVADIKQQGRGLGIINIRAVDLFSQVRQSPAEMCGGFPYCWLFRAGKRSRPQGKAKMTTSGAAAPPIIARRSNCSTRCLKFLPPAQTRRQKATTRPTACGQMPNPAKRRRGRPRDVNKRKTAPMATVVSVMPEMPRAPTIYLRDIQARRGPQTRPRRAFHRSQSAQLMIMGAHFLLRVGVMANEPVGIA